MFIGAGFCHVFSKRHLQACVYPASTNSYDGVASTVTESSVHPIAIQVNRVPTKTAIVFAVAEPVTVKRKILTYQGRKYL